MDESKRELIIQNIDRLVRFTNFVKLSKACLDSELLTEVMLNIIFLAETEEIQQHKKLFEKITKRGPYAYDILCRILADLRYNEALAVLKGYDDDRIKFIRKSLITDIPTTSENGSNKIHKEEVDQIPPPKNTNFKRGLTNVLFNASCQTCQHYPQDYGECSLRQKISVKKSSRIHKHPRIDTYPMESKTNRGVFLMINIIEFTNGDTLREGADEDAKLLFYLFREMGFNPICYENLKGNNFFDILGNLLKSEVTRDVECFVMALMTHGYNEDGVQCIKFSDGALVEVKRIEQYFNNATCTNLRHKPKIFLFPFCRGDFPEKGVRIKKTQTDSVNYSGYLTDVCICYATSEGYQAHRDREKGSWYIQSFVKNMADFAHDTAFEDILKKIQADTAKSRSESGNLQTPNYVNKCFNKVLYFNPGAFRK